MIEVRCPALGRVNRQAVCAGVTDESELPAWKALNCSKLMVAGAGSAIVLVEGRAALEWSVDRTDRCRALLEQPYLWPAQGGEPPDWTTLNCSRLMLEGGVATRLV